MLNVLGLLFSDDEGTPCEADAFREMGFGRDEADYLGGAQWRHTSREAAVRHHGTLVSTLRSCLN